MVECTAPKLSDFGLSTSSYDVFTRTQCSFPRAVLLIYRFLMTGYFLGYQIYLWANVFTIHDYIFMTDWTYTVFTFYSLIALINLITDMSLQRCYDTSHASNVLKGRHMIQWLFYNVIVTWTCLVLVVFWGALYDPRYPNWMFDISCHALPGVFSVLELAFTATPCRLAHIIYPMIYGLLYLTFTLVYWGTGHPPIYSILDYSGNPGLATGSILGMVGFMLLFHPLVWGLTKLRGSVAGRLNCSQDLHGDRHELIDRM
ncbi:protein rolling stone-like isoform X3 [Lytechinus pictus]